MLGNYHNSVVNLWSYITSHKSYVPSDRYKSLELGVSYHRDTHESMIINYQRWNETGKDEDYQLYLNYVTFMNNYDKQLLLSMKSVIDNTIIPKTNKTGLRKIFSKLIK